MNYKIIKVGNRLIKRYKAKCNQCGLDRGYKDKNKLNAICYKCNNTEINKAKLGISLSEETRQKMSESAKNRKSKPKDQKTKSNRIYVRKNTDLQNKIKCKVKALLNVKIKSRFLSKNKISTFNILGYSIEEFRVHMESRFQPGMTWENHGEWHIDHVIPDSWFNYDSFESEDFKKSWSLNNLQPLWAKDNLKKNNKSTAGGELFHKP